MVGICQTAGSPGRSRLTVSTSSTTEQGSELIVLVHGMYANGQSWLRLGSELADGYEVIAYDARGHGRSDAPETGYDFGTRIADLVGLSMGAATVAWATADHSSLPRDVFLEDRRGSGSAWTRAWRRHRKRAASGSVSRRHPRSTNGSSSITKTSATTRHRFAASPSQPTGAVHMS